MRYPCKWKTVSQIKVIENAKYIGKEASLLLIYTFTGMSLF